MENQAAQPVGGNGPAQQAAGAEDVFLADEIIEALGPKPFRQGGLPV